MQNSYEVVKNAIHFNIPDRLPVIFSAFGDDDTLNVAWNQVVGISDNEAKVKYDEWGCLWVRSEVDNMGLIKEHPLDHWSDLEDYNFPDPDNPALYEGMLEKLEGSENKYVTSGIFMLLFERLHALRGFENLLMDLYLERDKVEKLADRIVEFNIRIIENIAERFPDRIHGFFSSDDWGTELNTFISLELWTDFFKPRYKKIFDVCHSKGWDVWLHSCGRINEYIPSFIDIGLNVINMQQPLTNGIKEIGTRFSGKICFLSLCDIQLTLPFKSGEEIKEEAAELLKHWGTGEGGFILGDYGDGAAIGVSDDTKKIMYDAFKKYDPWKK
jgi:uroporphyrinogen decarboxylase